MRYYAGDEGVEILLGPLATGTVDGTTVASARVKGLHPRSGVSIELDVSIHAQSVSSITLMHLTDGALNEPGEWFIRAFYYAAGGAQLLSSLETSLRVDPRRITPPT